MSTYVFTCGDVNGIGPEIVVKTLNRKLPSKKRKIIFVCPKNVFLNTISQTIPKFSYTIVNSVNSVYDPKQVIVLDIGNCRQSLGKVNKNAGYSSYKAILTACELTKNGIADSIITAPISKLAFSKAGIDFPGHTELLADFFSVKKYSMMFVSKKMIAGLATIHIPIGKIVSSMTKDRLTNTISVITNSMINDFNIAKPKIALLGLNPHAGENGKIGLEEETIIKPVLKKYKNIVDGPFVPDAYFGNKLFNKYDCTIGLYHDQVLIPFKLLNFNRGVNFTAGLPIVRTSPDHGTAFDIASDGIANPSSMIEAFNYAEVITQSRRQIH
jgi:4-hydroxythreonine-4-phosphate dehydrogenase